MSGAATAEERRMNMCVGAKLCTNKASTEAEARHICETQPPKPPKEPRKTCNCNEKPEQLATCLVGKLEGKTVTMEAVREAVAACIGRRKPGNSDPNRDRAEMLVAEAAKYGLI